MNEQELNNYFASRMVDAANSTDLNIAQTKYDQMQLASDRAHKKNLEAAERRRALMESNKSSFIGRLDLDEDSVLGQTLNTGAAFVSGASQTAGFLASLPANAGAAAEMQGITQEEMAAFAAQQQGKATPEQKALLQREVNNKGGAVDLWRQFQGLSDTVEGRISNAQKMHKSAQGIADTFDIGSIVNRTGQSNLEDDLREPFQDNWNKVTEGSATDKVAGVAGLLKNAIAAGVNNKDGLIAFLAENIPQMALGLMGKGGKAAMLASNVGYGFDNFQKGVEEFQKENGRMPAKGELDHILGWSAAGALAEQIGDISVLRGFGVGKGATQAASGEAAKRGVVASVAGIGKGTAQGFGSEAATEAFQTFAENQAQGKDSTAEDLYVSGAIGGLVGGAMRGGLTSAEAIAQGASEVQERAADLAKAQAAKKEVLAEAIKTGDVSKFTDKDSPEYSPENAVEALYTIARDSKDETVSASKLKEANAVVSSVREEIRSLDDQIEAKTNELVALDDVDTSNFTPVQLKEHEDKMSALDDVLDDLEAQQEALSKPLARSEKVMDQFTRFAGAITKEQKVNPKTSQEVDSVVNLSMAAPAQISDEALTALASNPQASDTQKAYASAALAYRAASKTADQVNTNVLFGEANGLKGIQQYRKDIASSLAAGDKATAQKQLDRMTQFANRHKSKAEVAAKVLAERQASGQTTQVTIAPDAQGIWDVLPAAVNEDTRKKRGLLNLHKGSAKVVAAAKSEALALDAAVAEMTAAIAVGSTPATTPSAATVLSSSSKDSSSAAKPASSNPSPQNRAPAQRQSQGQKDVVQSPLSPDNKGKGEGVASQAQAATPESSKTPAPKAKTDTSKPKQITKVEPLGEATARSKQVASEQEAEVANNEDLFNELQEAINDMQQGIEGAVERVEELQAAVDAIKPVDSSAGLHVFTEPKQKLDDSGLAAAFNKLNLVAQYFTQKKGNSAQGTVKPLSSKQGFLTALRASINEANAFTKEPLDADQQDAVRHFVDTVTTRPILNNGKQGMSWIDRIQANLSDVQENYRYRDMIKFMQFDNEGKQDLDENIKTAMAYAVYSWINENARGTLYNSEDSVRAALGLTSEDEVSLDAYLLIGKAGKRDKLLQQDLGKRVLDALNIKADKDALDGLDTNLTASIGAHAVKLAEDVGLLERTAVSNAALNRVIADIKGTPTESNIGLTTEELKRKQAAEKNSVQYFYRAKFDNTNELTGLAKNIGEAQKGTKSVLNKLFGVEAYATAPSTKPITTDQLTAAKTKEALPSLAQEIRKKENAAPFRVLTENFSMIASLPKETVLAMMGYDYSDVSSQHVDNRRGIEAKNFGLEQEYENFMAFVADMGDGNSAIDEDLFFNHEYWSNHRVGISETLVNPQRSKFQRALLTRPDWATEIDPTNEAQLNNLKLRIMEGFGHKTEKGQAKLSLDKFQGDVLNNQAYMDGVRAIIDTRLKPVEHEDPSKKRVEVTQEHSDAIQAAVKKGGENMHSFSALFGLAQLVYSMENGNKPFTSNVTAEIDGVTNGPILSHILLGAASSVAALFKVTNLGGIFSNKDEDTQYSTYRGRDGVQDLYETLMSRVLGFINVDEKTMSNFSVLVGELTLNGKVTSAGRNLVKTPLTALVFGSSLGGSFASMANKFHSTVLGKLEEAEALKKEGTEESLKKAQTIVEAINFMMMKGGLPEAQTIRLNSNMLETSLTRNQIDSLKDGFKGVIYKPVQEGMKAVLGPFMRKRAVFNAAANTAFNIYNAARKGITDKLMQEGMDSGAIHFTTQKKDRATGKDLPTPIRHPSHGLTSTLRAELEARLGNLKPIMASIYSNESGEKRAGIALEKRDQTLSGEVYNDQEVKFGTPTAIGTNSVMTSGTGESLAGPGVRMLPMGTHSLDSGISHFALMSYFNQNEELKGAHTQVLNVHDAHIVGLNSYQEAGQNLNRSTFNSLLRYSPFVEMETVLHQTIEGMTDLLRDPEMAKVIQPYLAEAVEGIKLDGNKVRLSEMLSHVSAERVSSERIRTGFLADTKSLDQYAAFDGNHLVTDKERAMAEKLNELAEKDTGEVAPRVLEGVARIGVLAAAAKGTIKPLAEDPEVAMEQLNEKAGKILSKMLNPAVVASVVTGIKSEEAQSVKSALDAGKTVEQAVDSLTDAQAAAVVSDVLQVQKQAAHAFSPWGELGTSAVEHDMSLVQALTNKPVMGKADVLAALKPAIINAKLPRNIREFNAQLYRLLASTAPDNLEVRYVTPDTSSNDVLGKGAERSRGWYMAKGGSNQIYVLSPDHKYSGITPELLLHELTHSALAGLIEKSTDPEVRELVDNLDALRFKAIDFMKANGLNEFSPAVVNTHEFISWGMTNADFQSKVLARISGKAPRAGNTLVAGMKAFVANIVEILFRKSDKSTQAKAVNGMTLMVKNTAGLFKAAAAQKSEADILLNMASVDPAARVKEMTSEELFTAIQDSNPANQPSAAFNTQLQSVLTGLASTLHAPMASVIAAAETQSTVLTPLDAFTRTLATGKAPFAAASIATGLKVNNQEAFVMENIEAAMRAALANNTANTTTAYRELVRVQQLARKQVRPMDFLPEGVTEATATQNQKDEAKKIWKSVFDHTGKDYMPKFVALALGNEQVASKLGFDATREVRDADSLYEKIMQLFDRLVNLVIGKLTKTTDSGNADEFIRQLAEDIVDTEAKRRKQVLNNKATVLDSFEEKTEEMGDAVKEKLDEFSKSKFFANAKNGYIRGAGAVISIAAAPERVMGIMDAFNAMRTDALSKRQDLLSSLVSEMRGLSGVKDAFLKLIMATKNIERERSKMGEHLGKAVAKSFARDNFTKQEQAALTQLMHNDIGALFNQYNMNEIQNLMEDPAALQAEITKYESRLRKSPNARAMLNMSKGLGYYMATGVAKTPHLLRNAHNIVRMGGTSKLGTVPESMAIGLEADADLLISMYAMKYTPASKMTLAKDVLREEMNRTDGGNGIEVMLKVHRDLQAESKKSLFEGNEALAIKGYLPEVTNPYITFKIADATEGAELLSLGYTKGSTAAKDPQDPSVEKHVYIIRDGGISRWVSGSLSYTGNQRKGTPNQVNTLAQVAQLHADKMAAFNAMNTVDIDPTSIQESYMVPVMNNRGEVVDYVYTASNDTRDTMLERDNRFDHLLGTLAGNTYDKVESPAQNKAVLEALKAQYDADLDANQTQFIRVAPDADPEYADLWNMLPDQTKKDAEAIFGGKEIFLRNDLEDVIFGYRKQSLASLWGKPNSLKKKDLIKAGEYTKYTEEIFKDVVETMMRMIAWKRNENPDDWVKRAPMYVRNGEDIWGSIVAETKDIIVVRTGVVLMGNIMSNFTVLHGYGVPFKDMIRHHRVALKAATAYEQDSFELTQIQTQLATGVLQGKDRADLEDKVRLLEDAIARNPVKELIDAGLMPTIVEDLGSADDIYSYKNQLARKVEKYTDKLNPTVKKGLEYAYVGQKTPLYQGLNRATQLSDFVARYTLFHHLQERKNKPLSRSEAITRASDAFVNYDIPTHRSMQYMNDMGLMMFTKYYLRIQRVILQMFAEKPARMMMMGLMGGFFNGFETILDSNMLGRLGNNPFTVGALKYPTVLDDLVTVNAALSLK